MILVGDIGNSETKICLVNSKKKIIKRITFNTKDVSQLLLKKKLTKIKNIKKILFCSVVPRTFRLVKFFFTNQYHCFFHVCF